MTRDSPTVPDLQAAPELGVLDLLAAAIDAAGSTLVAEHPELCDLEYAARDGPLPTTVFLADSILRLGDGLAAAISAYRESVLPRPGTQTVPDIHTIDF